MFFFSRRTRVDDDVIDSGAETPQSEGSEKLEGEVGDVGACEQDQSTQTESVYTSFSPPVLLPGDVAVLVNALTGVVSRGVFSVEELRVVLPVVDKLNDCVRLQPDWFNFSEREVYTEDVVSDANGDTRSDGDLDDEMIDADVWGDEGDDDIMSRPRVRVYSRKALRKRRGRGGKHCGPRSRSRRKR